jgi:hypothetical protein
MTNSADRNPALFHAVQLNSLEIELLGGLSWEARTPERSFMGERSSRESRSHERAEVLEASTPGRPLMGGLKQFTHTESNKQQEVVV